MKLSLYNEEYMESLDDFDINNFIKAYEDKELLAEYDEEKEEQRYEA